MVAGLGGVNNTDPAVLKALQTGDTKDLSPTQLSLFNTLKAGGAQPANNGTSIFPNLDSPDQPKKAFGSSVLPAQKGIVYEQTSPELNKDYTLYTQEKGTPQSVSREGLAEYADNHKEQITQDANGKYFMKCTDGTEHEIAGFQKAKIGDKWTGWNDAAGRCTNADVTENTCLDNVVSNYNKTRPEGTRALTREDVVACNQEIFGKEGCDKRGKSVDGVANLFVGDELKLPVLANEEEFKEGPPQKDDTPTPTPTPKPTPPKPDFGSKPQVELHLGGDGSANSSATILFPRAEWKNTSSTVFTGFQEAKVDTIFPTEMLKSVDNGNGAPGAFSHGDAFNIKKEFNGKSQVSIAEMEDHIHQYNQYYNYSGMSPEDKKNWSIDVDKLEEAQKKGVNAYDTDGNMIHMDVNDPKYNDRKKIYITDFMVYTPPTSTDGN